ncbi:MAG: valine--tRNA ligase [Elusimicrobia bacterium]|nr:valine--tRNA ligase [Elusimicrobiota bacterium]
MLEKAYAPRSVEAKWAALWKAKKSFHAEAKDGGERPYVIVIPPPNVTGALHIGHALNNMLQDVLIRYHRLHGRVTCWVPGTDHGGIATQSVMEKQLRAEKLTRHQVGREKFLERMQQWTRDCKSTILGQLARLGCALDLDREAFTMDEPRARAVYKAFEDLWGKGLIKRGERMVNWCVRCGTALSDIEVEYEERKGKLWHMRYPGSDGSEGLVVATTRPETMLGDTAVAVNPRDGRYAKLVGKTLTLPLMDRNIPVVADDSVDFAFGTGAVKVTPAHDPNDFEISQRHQLPSIKVIGPDGRMSAAAGPYAGLSREAARDKVVEDLGARIEKIEDHPHSVGTCYRCNQVIEPLLSWQWFVSMKPLAEPAIKALDEGRFKLFPESKGIEYRNWLVGIKDWCISRQIWWGHRIPVWYCMGCNKDVIGAGTTKEESGGFSLHQVAGAKGVISLERPGNCAACRGDDWIQDPDVLDTWFSSGLWPLAVFGWPDETKDLKYFYPTQVLVTGYEIIYLWVARMQMMGLELRGEVPFPHALIHGIVRDKAGKKMSKSLGNVIDPLVMMDKHGTDAFRFSLAVQAHLGRDIPFAEDSITGPRNFANKVWNSTRFVLMNLPETPPEGGYPLDKLSHCCLELADKWILAEYQATLAEVRKRVEAYEIAQAADALYTFLWDKFCDWYVELAKIRLAGIDGEGKEAARAVMVQVLTGTLQMLHPFMPYITEELFEALKPFAGINADSVLDSKAPALEFDWADPETSARMKALMEMVVAIRTTRSELNVPPKLKLKAFFQNGHDEGKKALIQERSDYILHLARLESLAPAADANRPAGSVTAVAAGCTFYLPLEGVVDFQKERARLEKELVDIEKQLAGIQTRLSNLDFVKRAPAEEVRKAQAQRDDLSAKKVRIRETLASLG